MTTNTEQVQVCDLEQGDLIQMGGDGASARFREVFEVQRYEGQTTGHRVQLTVSATNGDGKQTMTDLLPFLTITRRAV